MTRRHSQDGVTLIEVLLAIALTAIILTPLASWTITTLRQQHNTRDTLANVVATGRLARHLTEDVASARTVATAMAAGDCSGGPGVGTVRLVIVSGGLDQTKIVYTEARPKGAPSGSPERSLWRRVCASDGTLARANEVFADVLPGSVDVTCPFQVPSPPSVGSDCADETNRRVRFTLTPAGPTESPRPVSLQATRRANSDSIGVPGSGNRPPIAQITTANTIAYVGTPVSFSGAESEDLDGTIAAGEYKWEFPSSAGTQELVGAVVQYTFDSVGEHTVLLRVTDDLGATNVAAATVRVVNRFPVATMSISPDSGVRGTDEFTFDATGSMDPDGPTEPLTYTWDLGPGLGADRTKTGQVVRFTFPAGTDRGIRQITLTVTDRLGGTDVSFGQIALVDSGDVDTGIQIRPRPVLTEGRTPRVGTVGAGLPPLDVEFSLPAGSDDGAAGWRLVRAGSGELVAEGTALTLQRTFGPTDHGEYRVVRVDSGGAPVGPAADFRVNARPTAAFVVQPGASGAPRTVEFRSSGTGGSSDPDGSIVSWRWIFGFFDNWTSTNVDPVHVFTEPGNYTVHLEVTDDDGVVSTVEQVVVVSGVLVAPPAPVWQGGMLVIEPRPGAAAYRVTVLCDTTPSTPPTFELVPTIAPRFELPADACPPGPVSASLEVKRADTWSLPSTAVVRP